MKTFVAKEHEVEKKWHLIDAKDRILGRLASKTAIILRGKHKPSQECLKFRTRFLKKEARGFSPNVRTLLTNDKASMPIEIQMSM